VNSELENPQTPADNGSAQPSAVRLTVGARLELLYTDKPKPAGEPAASPISSRIEFRR
jgi:hypothetical protein